MRAIPWVVLITLVACAETTTAPAEPATSPQSGDGAKTDPGTSPSPHEPPQGEPATEPDVAAVDADAATTPGTSTGDAGGPPPTLSESEPLDEALSFAFVAGYDNDEQLWLVGDEGALLRISTWDTAPETDDCGASWGTDGYATGSGRFSRLHFAADGKRLLFNERLDCYPHERARVLAYELASGTTSVLLESDGRPQIISDDETTIIFVRHAQQTLPEKPLRADGIDLLELVDGALRRIEPLLGADWLRIEHWDGAFVARWQERTLLLVDGISPLERVDGVWQHSTVLAPLDGNALALLTVSPSGKALCVPTNVYRPDGSRESFAWVLDPDGEWSSVALESTAQCIFSPDESRVAVGDALYELDGALSRVEGPALPYASASWRGVLYGRSGDDVSRTDWTTLTTESVLAQSSVPALCDPTFGAEGRLFPFFPPDDRPLAIGKVSCGCIDCDISGSFTWNADNDRVETIESAWGEHDVYGAAWLPDGGAVVLSTQGMSPDETMPAAGTYFHIAPDGHVETIGPLPGVEGSMQGPVSYPASRTSQW